jgi:hypothetical protein
MLDNSHNVKTKKIRLFKGRIYQRLLSSFPVLLFCAVRGGGGVLGLDVRSAARWRTSLSWTVACFAGASGAFFHVF